MTKTSIVVGENLECSWWTPDVVGEIVSVELGGVPTRASRVQTVENDSPAENRDANRDLSRLSGELLAYGLAASPFAKLSFIRF